MLQGQQRRICREGGPGGRGLGDLHGPELDRDRLPLLLDGFVSAATNEHMSRDSLVAGEDVWYGFC